MAHRPDWQLRGYVVEELIGRGASSSVWRGRVAASGDAVALKRMPALEPAQLERAHAEAALLGALDHPYLVRLHALVRDDEAAVLVLDLADGGSLAQLLAARGRLSPGEVITALAPVAAALAYVHDEGVVHGDVTPANVLFTRAGVALLADLGVARLTGDLRDAESTPAYIDPAVAAGCVPGPPSDVFMLAAVALHALTGAPPWPQPGAAAALAEARAGALPDVAAAFDAADVPEEMAGVLRRALAIDPHRRGTAADLALDLRHSGTPVAVELTAGRARPAVSGPAGSSAPVAQAPHPRGGRHAALPLPGSGRPWWWRRRRAAFESGLPGPDAPSWVAGLRGGAGGDPDEADVGGVADDGGALGGVLRAEGAGDGGAAIPAADPGRPAFERPATGAARQASAGALAPTRTVGPRPRPVLPRRALPRRGGRRRSRVLVLGAVAVVLLVAAVALWRPGRQHARTPQRPPGAGPVGIGAASLTPASASGSRSAPHRSSPGAPSPRAAGAAATSAARAGDWAGQLQRLDALRARAFATRDAGLLAQVYVPGRLLRADTALLERLVPTGCGLLGARTRYVHVLVILHGAGGATLSATASLPAATLVCHGAASARSASVGPATVRVTLTRTAGGVRIAEQVVR